MRIQKSQMYAMVIPWYPQLPYRAWVLFDVIERLLGEEREAAIEVLQIWWMHFFASNCRFWCFGWFLCIFPQTVCPLTLSTHCPILPLSVVPLVHIGLTKTLLHWCFFPLCLSTLHYWAQAILFQHETVVQCGTILLDTLWYINLLHPIAEDREH